MIDFFNMTSEKKGQKRFFDATQFNNLRCQLAEVTNVLSSFGKFSAVYPWADIVPVKIQGTNFDWKWAADMGM